MVDIEMKEYLQNIACKTSLFFEKEWSILTITTNAKTGRILFCIPGFSEKSYTNFVLKIKEGMGHIKDKYDFIIILKFSETVKNQQNIRLNEISPEDKLKVENGLYNELAHIVYKIIHKLKRQFSNYNFDILGKSAGCGVSVFLCRLDNSITRLFLAVPAIINKLEELIPIKDRIKKFKMHMVKDDDTINFSNYEEYNRQSKELFDENVIVYEQGGHELSSSFLENL